MRHSRFVDSQLNAESEEINNLSQSIIRVEQKLDVEITAKQQTIQLQEEEILRLHRLVEEKNNLLMKLNEKLQEQEKISEGNKQLINKLLNDLDRLNQDVEWYKKTYETRSLLGTIKTKIFKK